MTQTPAAFRFSLWRMLLLMTAVGACLAGLRVLPLPWALWLITAAFYFSVVLCFSSVDRQEQPAREQGPR